MTPEPPKSADPTQIGRYQIVSVLGRGAMGVVYRAHDPEIDRTVAIKIVHSHLLSGGEQDEFVARFRREAQAAARCAHPNVVAVYDFALHQGDPFLAMEFIDGLSLAAARQAPEPMPVRQAVDTIGQVLDGLAAAHAAGITHRDVKPANIMLTRTGTAKIADFGISRLDTSSLTAHGMMVGTPSYMSPEQAQGDTVDGRSDLYSAGIVLYELLAGTRPFAGLTAGALYLKLATEPAPAITDRRPDLPPPLAAAITRSLQRNRDHRFQTATEMATALRQALTNSLNANAPSDGTIVMPGRTQSEPSQLEPALLATIERRLAEHVGPIARYLVHSAARRGTEFDELCQSLAGNIDNPEARARFTRDLAAAKPAANPSTIAPATNLDPATIAHLQSALTQALGPIAKILLKRAKSTTLPALWQEMSTHIDHQPDRTTFLKKAPK